MDDRMKLSRLHLQRNFVMLDLEIAQALGVNEAIFLDRLHYHLEAEHGFVQGGVRYFRNTVDQWVTELKVVSKRTVERLITKLEAEGAIFSCKAGKGFDQTKGYSINYEFTIRRDAPRQDGGIEAVDMAGSSSTDTQSEKQGSPTKVDDIEVTPAGFDREAELELVRSRPDHGPTLAKFWRRCLKQYGHVKGTQPEMKIKDQANLKQIVKLLPDPAKLADALQHYALFVNFTREGYNLTLASKPQVPKMLLAVEAIAEFEPPQHDDTDYSKIGLKGLLDDGNSSD